MIYALFQNIFASYYEFAAFSRHALSVPTRRKTFETAAERSSLNNKNIFA
jgi:hypothetical protein